MIGKISQQIDTQTSGCYVPIAVNHPQKINNSVFAGTPFGPTIDGLPEEVLESYSEARRCMEVNAYTAAELICRKILMHVAADKGADEGKSFAAYLT